MTTTRHHTEHRAFGLGLAARRATAEILEVKAPAVWHKASVRGAAMPTTFGMNDATARRPKEASP